MRKELRDAMNYILKVKVKYAITSLNELIKWLTMTWLYEYDGSIYLVTDSVNHLWLTNRDWNNSCNSLMQYL